MFHVKQLHICNKYNSLKMNNKVLMDNLRCIPDFPKKGINFRDVTTLYKNAECMKIMTDELYELYKDKGITKIVGIESRGFVMAAALAVKLGAGVVLARKPGKLPSTVIKESFSKEYGVDTIEMHLDSINENDVVLIHDDLLATGRKRCGIDSRRFVGHRWNSKGCLQTRTTLPPQEGLYELHHRDYRRGTARTRRI